MSLTEEDQNLLQKQLGRKGNATQIIELLGIQVKDSSCTSHVPAFHDPVVKVLYDQITGVIQGQAQLTKNRQELRDALEEPDFLEDALEHFLSNFGDKIWGRENRAHLVKSGEGGLYYDNPEDRKKYALAWTRPSAVLLISIQN